MAFGDATAAGNPIEAGLSGIAPTLSLRSERYPTAIEAKGRLSEAELKWVQRLRDQAFASEDYAEGKTAFNEGRDPQFEDR